MEIDMLCQNDERRPGTARKPAVAGLHNRMELHNNCSPRYGRDRFASLCTVVCRPVDHTFGDGGSDAG